MRTIVIFLYLILQATTVGAQTFQGIPEICNNGIDDDGDGLIDCYDIADCPCASDHDCTLDQTRFPITLDLSWESYTIPNATTQTPVVGNLNPWADNIAEILIPAIKPALYDGLYFLTGDGSNKNNPGFLKVPGSMDSSAAFLPILMPAIADLDGNGVPEVFVVCSDKKIRVYTNYNPAANPVMELWTTSIDTCQSAFYHAYCADFDEDGIAEIYAGNEVFGLDLSNPANPVLKRLAKGTGPSGEGYFRVSSSIAADLLTPADCNGDPDCNGLEIAAGYGIYSIDIDPNDGDGMQIKLQRNINSTSLQAFSDGFTAVADLNHDNIQEVVVPGIRNQQVGVYVWNKTGFWRFLSMNIPIQPYITPPSACSIGNVFDDRTQGFSEDWPEVIFRYGNQIRCFNLHPASGFWWSNNTLLNDDNSGQGIVSLYDFDNDGLLELVVQDEDSLRICYGGSAPFPLHVNGNRTITGYPSKGVTTYEIPVIADVDGNGNPEILVHNYLGSTGTIFRVIHPKGPDYSRWLPARNIWNQFAYHVVNINDDLTVPKVQQAGYLEMPGPGSGKRPFNTFLAQRPAYFQPDATPYFPSADLEVKVTEVICQLPTFKVKLEICNLGDAPSADTTKIRFYRAGDPFSAPASNSFADFTLTTQSIPPGGCIPYTAILPIAFGNVYAVLNDWGNYSTPLPAGDTAFYRQECNLQNNVVIFKLDLSNGPPVSLGPDQVICNGTTTTLTASAGFNNYLWQNGATTTSIQVSAPGIYWVEAKDLCLNIRRDTVVLVAGNDFQTVQGNACEGTFFSFGGQNIPAGSSQSFVYQNSAGCDSTILVQVNAIPKDTTTAFRQICPGDSTLVFGNYVHTAGVFTQNFSNSNGCDSTHAVTVSLFPAPVPTSEMRQICPGDSTLVFGNYVNTAGVFTQNFSNSNGCDSTHAVMVNLFPAPVPTSEMRQICPGDSILVFGNYVNTAGVFTQNFSNSNGCDSTHAVTVSLFPAPVPTSETRQICPGDSTLVFGNYVNTAGVFTQNYLNTNGCDSTHAVTVSLLLAPVPTSEMRQICPGDSTLVFGNYVNTAGLFTQNFSNSNGCDSTHSVTVSLLLAPVPTSEMRQICPGDSILVFGNYVHTAGVFIQNFPNANGCDSIHAVTVNLLPALVPTSEMRQICPGDSTLVFGDYVNTAGVFSQIFPNSNGCDSTHAVTVSLFPAPVPTSETRQVCPGDSTLVFGNYVQFAGLYSQFFPNANGCDSLHSIAVEEVSSIELVDSVALCPGDSVLVFGHWVLQPTIVQELVPGIIGCDTLWTIEVQGIVPPIISLDITRPNALQNTGKVEILSGNGSLFSLDGLQFSAQTLFESLSAGAYTLYQEFEGCLRQQTFVILPFEEEVSKGVFAPNIMAPGAGNSNAQFTLYASPGYVDHIAWLRIYDRWGSLVFERNSLAPNDESSGWNGQINGKAAAPGVYFWQAMLEYSNGERELKKGDLTLIR